MSLLYTRIFSCFIMVNTLFLLYLLVTVESAFKMAAIQVLFNSVRLCITTLTDMTDMRRWIVTELSLTIKSNNQSSLSKCM